MSAFSSLYRIRDRELLAFRQLGLTPPSELPHALQVDLGEVITEGDGGELWRVRVFVTAHPARFFRFDITRKDGSRARISTGSGELGDFWPTVVLVAEEMLEVEDPRNDERLVASLESEDFPRPMGVPTDDLRAAIHRAHRRAGALRRRLSPGSVDTIRGLLGKTRGGEM